MDKTAKLPANQRKELFQQTAAKLHMLSEAAIEKDFWVCWMLKKLFTSRIKPGRKNLTKSIFYS